MPPTRIVRYCCSELKEHEGTGRVVVTGVRWSESSARKRNRGIAEVQARNMASRINLLNDNDELRKEFETCQTKGRRVVNPIVDWSDDDVWEFIKRYALPINPLYSMGFNRVGCVGCPMSHRRAAELDSAPKYKQAFMRTLSRIIDDCNQRGTPSSFATAEEWYSWWIEETAVPKDDGQIAISVDARGGKQ